MKILIGIISLSIYSKNPLESKWENSFRGSFYLVKGKAFQIGGGISKNP
jgi:hypothetical protein